jgi:hypothetical protein
MWDWNADTAGLAAEDGRFVTVYVNEYISYPSLQDFLVFYDTVPAEVKCFYEMSRAGCINKLFLDVDDESGGTDVNTLRAIIAKLCAYFSEVFGRTLDPGQFAITDSSRQKGSGYKNSYHGVDNSKFGFIVPAKGEHGDMKIFMLSFRAKFPGFADVVDKLVYTPNRPMRMIGSHKAQDPHKTALCPLAEITGVQKTDYFLQSDIELEVLRIPDEKRAELLQLAGLSHSSHSGGRTGAGGGANRTTRTAGRVADLDNVPQDVQDILRVQADEICSSVTFREVTILNADMEGFQKYTVYCNRPGVPYECKNTDCGETHVSNNFLLAYDRHSREIEYFSFSCATWITLSVHPPHPPANSHYDLLGVQITASTEDIRAAYRRKILDVHPDKGGTDVEFQRVDDAYRLLSDPDQRQKYDDQGPPGGGDDGDAQLGFREGPLTLADIRKINEILFQYLMAPMHQKYLLGYEEDVEMDLNTVVAEGRYCRAISGEISGESAPSS